MRVLVLTRFYLNGQTAHVFSLCSRLKELGHDPCLAAANLNHPAYSQWLQARGIKFTTNTRLDLLERLVGRSAFDVIHTHSSHTLDAALDLGRKHRIPVVATCHYLGFQPLSKLAEASKIIVISEEMRESLVLPAEKTVVIENGIDLDPFKLRRRKESIPPRALIAARMTEQKEPGYIQLAQGLVKRGWQVRSVGNWRPAFLGIEYAGWRIDLSEEYLTADLVIGTGRSIREGMAAGTAALVLGDHLDGIVTEENVELLRRCNFSGRALKLAPNEENIAAELDRLVPDHLGRLQEFGFHYARAHFSDKAMAQAVVEVYQSCLPPILSNSSCSFSSETLIRSSTGASANSR